MQKKLSRRIFALKCSNLIVFLHFCETSVELSLKKNYHLMHL